MLYNETKSRKATANETAKAILIDAIESRSAFIYESFYLDDIKKHNEDGNPTKEYSEICRHFEKHYDSIIDRLTNGDRIINK
tara:strand:+ start:791 stop:1036 length:246 start_codon:yes stop_codon:yes gene_type:complete